MQNENIKRIPHCLFLLLSASLLFAISNPNILIKQGLSYTAWVMYVPYFFLIKKASLKNSWLYSGLYGLLSVFFYGSWLYNYNPVCLYLALVIAFIGLSLLGLFLKLLEGLFKKEVWFIWALSLSAFEYVRSLGFFGFHYGLAAYTQWKMTILLQSLSLFGPFGLNLIIVFSSAIIFAFLSKIEDKRILQKKSIEDNVHYDGASYVNYVSENQKLLKNTSLKLPLITAGIWLCLFMFILIYGGLSLKKNEECKTIKVAAIQHNDDPESNGLDNYHESLQALIQLTDQALEINPDIDIVLWPETAFVPSVMYHYSQSGNKDRQKLVNHLLNYIDSRNPVFIIGNQHIALDKSQGQKNYYNSALLFKGGENVIPPDPQIYSKIKLVPVSEYFPYEKFMPHVYKAILNRNKFFWTQGKELKLLSAEGIDFYTPICFENTFPSLCSQAHIKGADCFFSLTNDSWAKSLPCQYMHLAMAKFRALENRLPVVISAVSGFTAMIDNKGHIKELANPFSKNYIVSTVDIAKNKQKLTIYNKSGDLFGYGSLFLLLALLIIRLFIVIIKKNYVRTHRI